MPGIVELPTKKPTLGFSVAHQKVDLEIDFASKSLNGKTEITIHPHQKDLKFIRLNFRQGEAPHGQREECAGEICRSL